MKLSNFKRLFLSDFKPEEKELVDQMSYTINPALDELYLLGANNITLADNISCTVSDVIVAVDAEGFPKFSITYPLRKNSAVVGLSVISANSNTLNPVYPVSGLYVSATKSQNSMVINHIAGLPANVSFTLRIVTYQN